MIASVTQVQQEMLAAEKGRRKREQRERDGRDLANGARTAADGYRDAQAAEAREAEALKTTVAPEGPGHFMQPGHLEPESVDRNYIEAGHASESPQAHDPRQNPMLGMVHAVLPTEPMAARIHPAVIANCTMGSPSERAR